MATPTQAVSSPAEMQDPFNGIPPTVREFTTYRATGEVPPRFGLAESAEPATAEPAEGEPLETVSEPAPENDQEPPAGIGNKARRRFEKLLAEKKALERQIAALPAKQDTIPAPSAAPEVQQNATRPEPTINDVKEDGTLKYADYADFVKALGRWSAEQTLHEAHQRQIQQTQTQQVQEKVERDRARYGDEFDNIIEPTAGAIMSNASIPMEVKRMLAQSDVLPELVYTLGTDAKTMEKLVSVAKSDPQQAMYYLAELSADIRHELETGESNTVEDAPEPKRTSAPKPPSPVTGPSSRAFDVSDESLSPEAWARKRNAQLSQRGHS